jgi:hypothetical protein
VSVFRSPLYLDIETLVPLANYHNIEVMIEVAVTRRDLGQRSGKAGLKATIPVPGSPGFEIGGSKGSESEVTQAQTVKDHPTNALNRLLDALASNEDVVTDLSADAITRRQLVELDGDWRISPATDVGSFLAAMVAMVAQNPSVLKNSEPPAEFFALMTPGTIPESVVLDTTLDDAQETRVLVLLDSGCLVGQAGLDDVEGERTVFGQVDSIIAEGSPYSLEKFFLSGFGSRVRLSSLKQSLSTRSPPADGAACLRGGSRWRSPVVPRKGIKISQHKSDTTEVH